MRYFARFSTPTDPSWLCVIEGTEDATFEVAEVTDVCASAGISATLLDVASLRPVGVVDQAGNARFFDRSGQS